MHDTFLNQNLYNSIIKLCNENAIAKIYNLVITVHTHSHVSEQSIREFFSDRKNALIGKSTNITIQKEEIEPLTATIDLIDGAKADA